MLSEPMSDLSKQVYPWCCFFKKSREEKKVISSRILLHSSSRCHKVQFKRAPFSPDLAEYVLGKSGLKAWRLSGILIGHIVLSFDIMQGDIKFTQKLQPKICLPTLFKSKFWEVPFFSQTALRTWLSFLTTRVLPLINSGMSLTSILIVARNASASLTWMSSSKKFPWNSSAVMLVSPKESRPHLQKLFLMHQRQCLPVKIHYWEISKEIQYFAKGRKSTWTILL